MTLPTPTAPQPYNTASQSFSSSPPPDLSGYTQQAGEAAQETGRLSAALDGLSARFDGVSKRAGKKLISFSAKDFAALSGAAADSATFEKQLGTLNATAQVTPLNMRQVKKSIEDTFTSMPVARGDVVALATSLTNLGVTGARDVGKLIKTFEKLGAATGESPQQLASGLVQLSRLFGTTDANKINGYANSLLTVSKNAGVSASGVLSFSQAIAPLARQAGISQASVLGISTAFSKAGADGFLAANTFNSIVSDITGLIQSGSPQLAKYANLIGVTSAQFKKMDKTTALEKIFTTISDQGPKAINTLNRLGIDGVRAQSAIAAVVQSGDLEKNIRLAQDSAGDDKNLTKASGSAKGGLVNNLTLFRNQITDIGDTIGEGLVGPATAVVKVFTSMANAVGLVLKPFAPLIDILGVAIGLFSALGGGALLASGILAKVALAGFVGRSSPVGAFRGGRRDAMNPGATPGVYGQRAQAGQLRWWQRPAYAAGARLGGGTYERQQDARALAAARAARGLPVVPPPTVAQRVRTAPFRVATSLVRGNTEFMQNAGRPGEVRTGGMLGSMGNVATRVRTRLGFGPETEPRRPMPGPGVVRVGRPMPGPGTAGLESAEKSAARLAKANLAAVEARAKLNAAEAAAAKAVSGTADQQAAAQRSVAVATRQLGAALLRTQAATVAAGTRTAGAAGASALGMLGRGARGALGGVGGVMGLGFIGLMVAPMISKALDEKAKYNNDTSSSMNPLKKLNDQLGVATTNLASFSVGVKEATPGQGGIPANISLRDASKVSSTDVAASGGLKNTDKTLDAVAAKSKNDPNALIAYGRSLHMSDNRSVAGFKNNLLAKGIDPATVDRVLAGITKGGTGFNYNADYGLLTRVGAGGEGQQDGLFAPKNLSKGGSALNQGVFSGIGQQYNLDRQNHSVGYAKTREYQRAMGVLTTLGGSADKSQANMKQLENALQILTGASPDEVSTQLRAALPTKAGGQGVGRSGGVVKARDYSKLDDPAVLLEALNKIDGGKYVKSITGAGGVTDLSKIPAYLRGSAAKPVTEDAYISNIKKSGPLGSFTQSDASVKAAVNAPSDNAAQYKAMISLYQQAESGSTSLASLITGFDKLEGAINDVDDPLYKLSRSARAYAQKEEQYALPDMSRNQQLSTAAGDYRRAQIAQRDNPTADTPGDLSNAKDQFISQRQSMTQYYNSVYSQLKGFNTQMIDAEKDRNVQVYRMNRDFEIQELQGEEDFQRSRFRQVRDHNIQLEQQNRTSAQSIYNPYQRVQSQYTASGGTLEQNLGDENQRLRRQKRNLDALKAMGLSLEAIQTLNLASPDQAQQLDRLVMDAKADGNLIGQLNAQTAKRIKLTKSVTQNDYNLTFQQSSQDFSRGLKDASTDYNVARDRAVAAQKRSLDDMATDYNKMVYRAGRDLRTSMTELYGGFGSAYGRALDQMNGRVNKIVPGLAKNLKSQLESAANLINGTVQITIAPTTHTGQSHEGSGPGYGQAPAAKPAPVPTRGGMPVVVVTGGHAAGGISMKEHVAAFSESNRAEMIVPLERQSGVAAMASFVQQVSMATLRTLNGRANGLPQGGGHAGGAPARLEVDKSTNFTGPITVQAQDPNEMQRKLEEKKRIGRLTAPTRSYGDG